jgi:hypothetical protein
VQKHALERGAHGRRSVHLCLVFFGRDLDAPTMTESRLEEKGVPEGARGGGGNDEADLARMGYKQELKYVRIWSANAQKAC